MTLPVDPTLARFELALAGFDDDRYELTLFIVGASDLSARAIDNVRQLCDQHLGTHYHLTIVDLLTDPDAVHGSGVLAAPTLVRSLPLPVRRLVGDLSRTERVLAMLDIPQPRPAQLKSE